MTTCHCLCFAAHAERGICDYDAPRAIVSKETAGTALGGVGTIDVLMCRPCAEAVAAVSPRVHGVVMLPQDDDAAD